MMRFTRQLILTLDIFCSWKRFEEGDVREHVVCVSVMQLDSVEALLELCGFVDALLPGLMAASGESWATEKAGLLLQLLCACQRCLQLNGDCRPFLALIQQLLPTCQVMGDHSCSF